ncbi:MAG: glycosyltransferase family 4 protein [Hyphomicrobiales bacterium]|nr:glycosyltransferase family 4 protein [Hyphomicrobiales bacterium]
MLRIDFAYPGDINAPTGGYGYDRRVMRELEGLGCDIRPIALPASFPYPTADDLAETQRLLAGGDRDALAIDGLAYAVLPARLISALTPRPLALVHHPLFLEAGLTSDMAARLRASEQAALDCAGVVVTTSAMTADIVEKEFSMPRERLFFAPPGVDPAPRAQGSQDGVVRLFSVGSLTPRKAYGDLVRALALVDGDWRLTIAGSLDLAPDYARDIAALIMAQGLGERIRLAGAMVADEIAAGYAGADIFVTPSHFEGFGMAIAEAVARGLPVIATREVAGAGAVPKSGALTYPAGDVQALAKHLEALISDAALRARLADGAWQAAQTQFRWSDTAQAFLAAVRAGAAA